MISTTGSTCSASSERTLSTSSSASSEAVAAGCVSAPTEDVGLRIASRTADQKRWASCWSRSTDTNATRRRLVERRAHARNSEVFPLPGGAETTVTRLVTARSSIWRRSSRSSRPRATESSLEIGCCACSPRSVVAMVVMRSLRSSTSIRLRRPIRSLASLRKGDQPRHRRSAFSRERAYRLRKGGRVRVHASGPQAIRRVGYLAHRPMAQVWHLCLSRRGGLSRPHRRRAQGDPSSPGSGELKVLDR